MVTSWLVGERDEETGDIIKLDDVNIDLNHPLDEPSKTSIVATEIQPPSILCDSSRIIVPSLESSVTPSSEASTSRKTSSCCPSADKEQIVQAQRDEITLESSVLADADAIPACTASDLRDSSVNSKLIIDSPCTSNNRASR